MDSFTTSLSYTGRWTVRHAIEVLSATLFWTILGAQYVLMRKDELEYFVARYLLHSIVVALIFARCSIWGRYHGIGVAGLELLLVTLEQNLSRSHLDWIRILALVALCGCDVEPQSRSEKAIGTSQPSLPQELKSWMEPLESLGVLIPIAWPPNRRASQCLAILALGLIAERAVRVLLPWQLGIILEEVRTHYGGGSFPWWSVSKYSLLLWMDSPAGLSLIMPLAEIPIQHFTQRRIEVTALQHTMNLSVEFHTKKGSAKIITAMHQCEKVQDLLQLLWREFIPLLCDVVAACVLMYALFGACMTMVPILATLLCIGTNILLAGSVREKRANFVNSWEKRNENRAQAINNWFAVLCFCGHSTEEKRNRTAITEFQVAEKSYLWGFYPAEAAQGLAILLGEVCALSWALYLVVQGEVPLGRLLTLVSYLPTFTSHLLSVSSLIKKMRRILIDTEKLTGMLKTSSTIVDRPGAVPLVVSHGCVEFRNVRFTYPNKQTPTLEQITFTAKPGQTIGLVGKSGSGKTTLTLMLARFLDVSDGDIQVDSQNISDVTAASVRDNIAWVAHNYAPFDGRTILENVRYGREGASEEEVHQACRLAMIHDRILALEEQYSSVMGQGLEFSAGEKQRLAIARMLVAERPIVVLDEFTSALDAETEKQIKQNLRSCLQRKTVFVIAHRLSTTRDADHILVLDEGEIVEQGRHDDLLQLRGRYHNLWFAQTEPSISQ